jgi:hypothetical protein
MNKYLLTLLLTLCSPLALAIAICDDALPRTSPTARFQDHGNGTVTDRGTGLIWMRCQLGQTWRNQSCEGEPNTLTSGRSNLHAVALRQPSCAAIECCDAIICQQAV